MTSFIEKEESVLSNKEKNLKIAHVTFSFENVKMIKLLTQRGSIITSGEIQKLARVDS